MRRVPIDNDAALLNYSAAIVSLKSCLGKLQRAIRMDSHIGGRCPCEACAAERVLRDVLSTLLHEKQTEPVCFYAGDTFDG